VSVSLCSAFSARGSGGGGSRKVEDPTVSDFPQFRSVLRLPINIFILLIG